MNTTTSSVKPILECVISHGDGEFTAVFGYENKSKKTIEIPIKSPHNRFAGKPIDRGQPSKFQPGRHRNVFTVDSTKELTWIVEGKSAKANAKSPGCETDFASTEVPLALFPVRLETRFFPFGGPFTHLLVRIYPDDLHVDSHEPELTDDEKRFGAAFWKEFGAAGGGAVGEEKKQRAWGVLANRYGAPRAAWIARSTAPGAKSHGTRDSSWTRPAHTRVLPSRWTALGYRDDKRVFALTGAKVPDTLQVGPSPTQEAAPGAVVEKELLWLTDFAEAEKVGMGIRVPLGVDPDPHFDRVVVFGTKANKNRGDSARLLAELLDAHHYTDGLAVVRQGTPTNNTESQPSGFSSREPEQTSSYDAERKGPLFAAGDGSDGDVLTQTLGIAPETLQHVGGASERDQSDARAMNTFLWEATWGYFFKQMVPGTVSDDELAALRRHTIDNLRGRGPVPVLRSGRQPYGILPVTVTDRALPEGRGRDVLGALRAVWRKSLANVPRVGKDGDTADAMQELVQVLSAEPVSTSVEGRFLYGEKYLTLLNDFNGLWADAPNPATPRFALAAEEYFTRLAAAARPSLPLPAAARLFRCTYDHSRFRLSFGLTGRFLQAQNTDPIDPPSGAVSESEPFPEAINIFTAVRALSYVDLRVYARPDGGRTALLARMGRSAKLLEYAAIAFAIELANNLVTPDQIAEPELVDVAAGGAPTRTPGRLLDDVVPPVTGTDTIGAFLDKLTRPGAPRPEDPRLGSLLDFLDAAATLEKRPTAAIDRAFREALDLSSHRLDAWTTSVATARLRTLRKKRARGIRLGGYGWVEDVRPGLRHSRPEGGFLVSPSPTHGVAAALLRNGRLSHTTDPNQAAFQLDLSSRRVRLARMLMDGVREGSTVAALLGYRFERGLKENHPDLDFERILPKVRELAPLVADKIHPRADPDASVGELAARNVVDGLQLRRLKAAGGLNDLLDTLSAAEQAAFETELAALDEAVDAVNDVSLAEAVFQLARGNHERAAAAMEAFGNVEALPPEAQVASTLRTGIGVTHRMLVLFSGDASAPTGWNPGALEVRAPAEPHLNAWAATLIGDPKKVQTRAEFLDSVTAQPLTPPVRKTARLADLALSPLDVLEIARPGETGAPSELERLLAAKLLVSPPAGVPANAGLRFELGRDPGWGPDILGFEELFEVARRARELVGGARPALPADLTLPTDPEPTGLDTAELKRRVDAAVKSLRIRTKALAAIDPATAPLATIRDRLLPLFYFGVPGAIPALATGAPERDRQTLVSQTGFVLGDAQRRLARHDDLVTSFGSRTKRAPEDLVAHDSERLALLLGPEFRVLPRSKPANAADLKKALAAGDAVDKATPFAALIWMQRASRVREGVGRLYETLFYAETLRTGDVPRPRIMQLPFAAGEGWVGQANPGKPLLGGRVSIVAHVPASLDTAAPIAGLFIDEWLEVVPSARETAAVSFQYDAPNARAPQVILLAVAPAPELLWDLDTLEAVVLETLESAKLRAVDPHALQAVGHVLPALYFAHNRNENDVPPTILLDVGKELV